MTTEPIVCPMCDAEFSAPENFATDGATCPDCGVDVYASAQAGRLSDTFDAVRTGDPLEALGGSAVASELLPPTDENTRQRKTFEHNPKLAGMIAGVVVVVIACGLLAALWVETLDRPMRYMPNEMTAMLTIRVADLMESEYVTKAHQELEGSQESTDATFEMASRAFGFSESMISHVEQCWMGVGASSGAVIYVRFKEEVTIEEVIGWLEKYEFETANVDGIEYQASDLIAFFIAKSQSVVFSAPNDLEAVLTRAKNPKLSDGMKTALAHADMTKTIGVAIDVSAQQQREEQIPVPALKNVMEILSRAEYLVQSVNIDADIQMDMTVGCADAEDAEELKTAAEGGLAVATPLVKSVLGEDGNKLIDGLSFENQDKQLNISTTVRGALVRELTNTLYEKREEGELLPEIP